MKKFLIVFSMCLAAVLSVSVSVQAANLDRAIISFSQDDADWTLFSVVYPTMVYYGLPFTAYVPTSYVGTDNHASWNELWEMYLNGMEIGSHGANHMNYTGKTYTQIYNDILVAKNAFTAHGFKNVKSFAYPYGVKHSLVVQALNALGLTSGRGAWDENDKFNVPYAFSKWWIESWSFRNAAGHRTFADLKPLIDEAVAEKKYLSIVLHKVYPGGGAGDAYSLDYDEFAQAAAYVGQLRDARLVDVTTVGKAVEKMLYFKAH